MKVDALLETIDQSMRSVAERLNYGVYHIEYVRENGEYYLKMYIDKDGGIVLSDCEALSRKVSDVMDEKNPTKEIYLSEASSPGLSGTLFTDDHSKRQIGKETVARSTKSLNEGKDIKGILKEISDDSVIVETDDLITIPRDKIKSANLEGEV